MLVALLSVIAAAPGCSGAVVPTAAALTSEQPKDTTSTSQITKPAVDTAAVSPKLPQTDSLVPSLDNPTPDTLATAALPKPKPIPASDTVKAPEAPLAPVSAHLVSLSLSAPTPTLAPGGTQTFSVSGVMSDGTTTSGPAVNWSALGGTVTQSGLFTAGAFEGNGSVTVNSGAISASVSLVISTPLPPEVDIPTRAADDFVNSIGVNLHLGYWDTPYGPLFESVIKPRLLQLGVHHVRDAGTVVNDDSWMSSVYGRMQDLASRGIKFDLVMQPSQGSTDYSSVPQLGRLLGFASSVVESFEGLNEHDLSGRPNWVAETRAFQSALFTAVRADLSLSSMPVLGPSMGHPVNAASVGTLAASMDLGNLHPYPGGNVPLANLADHRNRLAAINGGHASVVTETGYHTAMASTSDHPAVSEEAMGRYVPRLFLDNYLAGIGRSYLYELIDEGTSLANQEQNFGLLRHDGSPKPAFDALANLISVLADAGGAAAAPTFKARMEGDLAGVSRVAFTKKNGHVFVVLWQETSSYNLSSRTSTAVAPKSVTFRWGNTTQVRVYDPSQSSSPVSSGGVKTLIVSVTDIPLVIEITP